LIWEEVVRFYLPSSVQEHPLELLPSDLLLCE
jgi:hypothetical protein